MNNEYCIVFSTYATADEARKAIDIILSCKLAACIQTIDINSHYMWNGEICHDAEVLVLFKTRWALYSELEAKIKEVHPYETPEIIAVDVKRGAKEYLAWIDEVTGK